MIEGTNTLRLFQDDCLSSDLKYINISADNIANLSNEFSLTIDLREGEHIMLSKKQVIILRAFLETIVKIDDQMC